MKKLITSLTLPLFMSLSLFALPGDTTIVQTFSFNLGRNNNKVDTFNFPDGSKEYSKVLMYYTIKCDPKGDYVQGGADYPCGEWDYDVYTDILKPTGETDSQGNPIFDVWRLWSYITPYGIGLDRDIKILNNEGWRYVYDVTDFLPLLKNRVILKDGNAQELVDIKFAFIEGTPTRKVLDIKPVWSSRGVVYPTHWEGFPLSKFDSIVKDTTFNIKPNEKYVKLRTTVTGHFFGKGKNCGEFCNNIHKVKVNGQVIRSWDIIQPCNDNPMYPQGGTWLYARAGWCPGLEGKTNEFDLTPYVKNGSVRFDYDVEADRYGVYRITSYLVTYGDILQNDDAEAEMIISPSTNPNHGRLNPSAFAPIIVIKNLGKNNLTSAKISYGFDNQEPISYNWTGNIGFLQKDTIILKEAPDWNKISAQNATFYFEIISPNGKSDPTPYNNRIATICQKPTVYKQNEITMSLTTNNRPKETYWELTDIAGNVLYSIKTDTLEAASSYDTKMLLPNGSYCLSLYDSEGDGLGWWANKAAGKGSASLKAFDKEEKEDKTLFDFAIDFGSFYKHWFAINEFITKIDIENTKIKNKVIAVYPTPANDFISINLLNIKGENLKAIFYDVAGVKKAEKPLKEAAINNVVIKDFGQGLYIIHIMEGKKNIATGKFIVSKK